MSQYTQFTAIVPAQYAELYRQSAASVHSAAQGMFVTPLYTGSEITHYISTGMIDVDFIAVVTNPEDFASQVGVSLAEAQWFKDNFTYSAIGTMPVDEDDPGPMHNHDAIVILSLSLSPTGEYDGLE